MGNPRQINLPLTETIAPADSAGVAEVVRAAAGSGTPVYPIGGGTNLAYGVPPSEPGLGLSLAGLRRIVDHQARDLTVTVEAGVTIAELSKRLASERQRLPVDVPNAERATLGGVVSTNPIGPRRYRWGTMRDYVIGISAVDGEGTVFSSGGRVVKNAAGYDLCRLMVGSLGTLGVVTKVTLKVKPMPESSAMVACQVPDFQAAETMLAELVHTVTLPAAIELLAGPAWKDDSALRPVPNDGVGRLLVGFEGDRVEVDWMVERLQEDWRRAGISSPHVIRKAACEGLWGRLADFPAESGDGSPTVLVQIHALPGRVLDCVRLVLGEDPGCSVQAHAGDGVILVRFSLPPEKAAVVLDDKIRPALEPAGGVAVVRACPAEGCWSRQTVWGPARNGAAVMQSIKRRFDPGGILNRGRFVY
jgi:glycolate oxidase FAD binding subunit